MRMAHGFNRGLDARNSHQPRRGGRTVARVFSRPCGTRLFHRVNPRLKPWAIVSRPVRASRFTHHVSRN
jgi:hypothetical protein